MEAESTPSKEEQKQETSYQNPIQESIKEHGTTSYYHYSLQTQVDKELLKGQELIVHAGDDRPKQLKGDPSQGIAKVLPNVMISKYSFMEDGILMKVLVDFDKNPDLIGVTDSDIQVTFKDRSFDFGAVSPKTKACHKIIVEQLRNKIVPEECRVVIRKARIYIILKKTKDEGWYSLKY